MLNNLKSKVVNLFVAIGLIFAVSACALTQAVEEANSPREQLAVAEVVFRTNVETATELLPFMTEGQADIVATAIENGNESLEVAHGLLDNPDFEAALQGELDELSTYTNAIRGIISVLDDL